MAVSTKVGDMCRLCGTDTLNIVRHAIFEGEGLTKKYALKISECLPLQVTVEDPLPKNMCGECAYKLDLMSDFRDKAVKTEVMLVSLVEGVKPEIPDDDDGIDHEIDNDDDFRSDTPVEQIEQQTEPEIQIKEEEAPPQPEKRPSRRAAAKRPIRESDGEDDEIEEEPPAKKRGRKSKEIAPAATTAPAPTPAASSAPKENTGPLAVVARPDPGPHPVIGAPLYQCRHCEDLFETLGDTRQHISQEHKFKCPTCYFRASTEEELEEHSKKKHMDKENLPRCCICQRLCTDRDAYKQHLLLHVGSMPYECQFCEKLFADKGRLENHIIRHNTPSTPKRRGRPPKGFFSEKQISPSKPSVDPFRQIIFYRGGSAHACIDCNKKFQKREELREHRRLKHRSECPCGKKFSNEQQLQSHRIKVHPEWIHRCRQCTETFNTPLQLAHHMDNIHKDKTYKCSRCNKVLKTMVGMISHKSKGCTVRKRNPVNPKGLICVYCNGKFAERTALEKHIEEHLKQIEENKEKVAQMKLLAELREIEASAQKINTEEPIVDEEAKKRKKNETKRLSFVTCELCDKNTPPHTLDVHMKLHKGGKYVCEKCKYVAMSEAKMKEHTFSHNDITAPFFCSICKLNFRMMHWAEKHKDAYHGLNATIEIRPQVPQVPPPQELRDKSSRTKSTKASSNTKKKCSLCPELFTDHSLLNQHMKEQHVDKKGTQKCYQCNAISENFHALVVHVKLHGVNLKIPKSCTICSAVLNNSHSYNRHMNMLHPKCRYCNERLASRASLASHVSTKHPGMPDPEAGTQSRKSSTDQGSSSEQPNAPVNGVKVKQELKQEVSNDEVEIPTDTQTLAADIMSRMTPEEITRIISAVSSLRELETKEFLAETVKNEPGPSKPVAGPSKPVNLQITEPMRIDHKKYSSKSNKCHLCEAKYKTKGELRNHKINFHNCCHLCGKLFETQAALQNHADNHPALKCPVCDKLTEKTSDMQIHINRRHGGTPVCAVCLVIMDEFIELDLHYTTEHPAIKKCPICKHRMSQSSLKPHMAKHNQSTKSFSCKSCSKTFLHKVNLDQHERIHTGLTPYLCPLCPMSFMTGTNMVNHVKFAHNFVPKSTVIPCPWCNLKFRSISEIGKHVEASEECLAQRNSTEPVGKASTSRSEAPPARPRNAPSTSQGEARPKRIRNRKKTAPPPIVKIENTNNDPPAQN